MSDHANARSWHIVKGKTQIRESKVIMILNSFQPEPKKLYFAGKLAGS
jgi:hypothetical protein